MGLLTDIQAAVKTRLEAQEYFQGMSIVTESKGDIAQMVQADLTKTGVGVVVTTPAMFGTKANVPGPQFYSEAGGIKIKILIFENVPINQGSQGLQKAAADIAENVAAYLHQYHPEGLGIITVDPGTVTIQMEYEPPYLIYEVNLMTHGGLVLE